MNTLKEKISQLAIKNHSSVIDFRRYFHQHPELSGNEEKTASHIAALLKDWGISFEAGKGGHGIVAEIDGLLPSEAIVALRADMDALPITEGTGLDYSSVMDGVMHACGHDMHMASLLGVAKILNEIRSDFGGKVRLFFQPSEEKYPGGARLMIEEGVMDHHTPEAIFAQHVCPDLEAGTVGIKAGKYMASTDEIYLTVHGKGGHGGMPEKVIDPVLIASHIVVSLQQIVSRNANPAMPTVVSIGRFIAEGRTNIIPEQVKMEGTLRTFDEKWRNEVHQIITRMASDIAMSMGGRCEVFIDKGYPYLVNDEELAKETRQWMVDYLGESKVKDLDLRMTAEDFSYFAQMVPGCFYRLGVRNPSFSSMPGLHSSGFCPDEQSLITGCGLMAWLAVRRLGF
ncbi:MAG: M20 family metallopeptidase [Bacteroidales bacterium]|nr:M20 family metallopeptidase [Bacteroidales bacterium]